VNDNHDNANIAPGKYNSTKKIATDKVTENLHKVTNQTDSDAVCRICWGGDDDVIENPDDPTDINPLISPCQCTGTMGNIHLKCLRGWLQTKVQRKVHKKQVVLKFKKLDCELCKVNFPFKITY
jgi:E3 ubiquitin-protein ligase DOA10